jgi:hypothetical protein
VFQKLVSHNDDIRRLAEKGYAIGFDSECLLVRDIPYLDEKGTLQWGAFVTKLVFTDQEHVKQHNHQVYFAGSDPHNMDGTPIGSLGSSAATLTLSVAAADVVVQRQFSNKRRVNGQNVDYADFFDKIDSYASVIHAPAQAKYGAHPYTFRFVEKVADDSVFKIHDTLTSRAEITDLAAKFKNEIVAVIGLGGTGAYLLDFLVKTPVKEIRAFDRDEFHVHNAFRSPGHLDLGEFRKTKADIYQARYENFRHGLKAQAKFIDASCTADLEGVTFAFVCVDKGSSRAGIFDLLIEMKIPFIDVGMGLNRKKGPLDGMIRVTYYPPEEAQKLREKNLAETSDRPNDEYRVNIQTGELNALNAALAIIKYKQVKGFYFEEDPSFHLLFGIRDLKIAG